MLIAIVAGPDRPDQAAGQHDASSRTQHHLYPYYIFSMSVKYLGGYFLYAEEYVVGNVVIHRGDRGRDLGGGGDTVTGGVQETWRWHLGHG